MGCAVAVKREPNVGGSLFPELTGGRQPTRIALAERRGITSRQLSALLAFLQRCAGEDGALEGWRDERTQEKVSIESVNLYQVCHQLILPLTAAARCSYVEAVAESEEAQVPKWFVSHWWGEPVPDFVRCVQAHADARGMSSDDAYWVCAYANNQHELGAELGSSPRRSSFFKAMQIAEGVLLVLDEAGPGTPFRRVWCCFEESVVLTSFGREQEHSLLFDIASVSQGKAELITDGLTAREAKMEEAHRALAVNPSGWGEKSRREATFPLMVVKAGLAISICEAAASREADRRRILNAIAGRPDEELDLEPDWHHPAYDAVDCSLRGVFALAAWRGAVERREDLGDGGPLPLARALREDAQRKDLTLDLAGCPDLQDDDVSVVAESLPSGLQRLSLDCADCPQLTDRALRTLGGGLPRAPSLDHLRLTLARCTRLADLNGLAHQLPRTLTALELDFQGCGALSSVSGLAEALLRLPLLSALALRFAQCAELRDVEELGRGLAGPEALRSLHLDCKGCRGIALVDGLGPGISQLASLTSLELGFAQCSSLAVGGALWQSFSGLQSLTALDLNLAHCWGLQSVSELGESLARLPLLSSLRLNFYYCASLSPHIQWNFKSLDAFRQALAKGGRGRQNIHGSAGACGAGAEELGRDDAENEPSHTVLGSLTDARHYKKDRGSGSSSEEEEEEDQGPCYNVTASAGATSRCRVSWAAAPA